MASSAFQFFGQFFTADAHPPDLQSRIANHQGMVGDIFGHNCAGADEGVTADGVAADGGPVSAFFSFVRPDGPVFHRPRR